MLFASFLLNTTFQVPFLNGMLRVLPLFLIAPLLQCVRLASGKTWPAIWYQVVQDAVQRSSNSVMCHRAMVVLHSIEPLSTHSKNEEIFSLRWVLAIYGCADVLNWAVRCGIDLTSDQRFGFLYACLAAENTSALQWCLQNGFSPNVCDPRGNSLLAFALRRSTPPSATSVKLLLLHGANWYYKRPGGESGDDVVRTEPVWSRWRLQYDLDELGQIASTSPSRKL